MKTATLALYGSYGVIGTIIASAGIIRADLKNPNDVIGEFITVTFAVGLGLATIHDWQSGKVKLRSVVYTRAKNPVVFWLSICLTQIFVVFALSLPWTNPWLESLRR